MYYSRNQHHPKVKRIGKKLRQMSPVQTKPVCMQYQLQWELDKFNQFSSQYDFRNAPLSTYYYILHSYFPVRPKIKIVMHASKIFYANEITWLCFAIFQNFKISFIKKLIFWNENIGNWILLNAFIIKMATHVANEWHTCYELVTLVSVPMLSHWLMWGII